MATLTAQQMLDTYLQAELDVLAGKSVRFNDGNTERELRSEDLEWIIKGRKEWEARVSSLAARAGRAPTFGGLSYSVARLDGN
jgi:hypothetical protein